jgi:hypothetical protein
MIAEPKPWLARVADKFVEAVAPQRAVARAKARTALSREGAQSSRLRNSSHRIGFHPDSSRNQRDAVSMMFEARDLAENVGFVKGHLRKVQLYGAGTLSYVPNTGDPGMDLEISSYMNYWQSIAHTGLEHNFARLIQLALMGMVRDRDSMLVFQRDLDMLRLQIVEADQIGELYSISNTPGYVGGVFRNSDGTRAGYRVYDRTGDMQYRLGGNKGFIPAKDACFFIDPMRNSVRGVTAYDTSITNIRDKFEILGYEKIIVKDISTTGIITYTQSGTADTFDFDSTVQRTGTSGDQLTSYIQHREAGTREYRGLGEKFEVVKHDRPSQTFSGFLKVLDSENCQGLNLPYGFVVDPSEPGGVAARIIAHIANREFQRIQRDVLEPILNRIRTVILGDAIERKDISRHPRFAEGVWLFPPPPTADIQRESDISIREVRAGLSTYSEQYAQYGQSRREQWEIKMLEAVERHRLAWQATKILEAEGIKSIVQPDEIASMTDNPAKIVPMTDGKPDPNAQNGDSGARGAVAA